ncbi:SDR family oxidoreductase [Ideonella sp.]|uniref:SDR family oxidoreductase n=1 Tax=Ideonella sp. TaxID=1929293 RepID=UPI003BB599A6
MIDHPARAVAARFRRPVLLIVGCGDVGMRVLAQWRDALQAQRGWRVLALTSSPERMAVLRAAGAVPILGNLDEPASLRRLAGLADAVLHLAPPPGTGAVDPRTAALIRALRRSGRCKRWIYGSTSGVYGNCDGQRFDESRPVAPATDRARRRVDAETQLRMFGAGEGRKVSLLRIPGIYAVDRVGGHPRDRVLRGAPVLHSQDDVYTNHIHADDLARACIAALHRGAPQRAYHVSDDSSQKMGDHFDAVADRYGLPRPPRISRAESAVQLSPMQLSFMGESRQLINQRMKRELRLSLRFPSVLTALLDEA